MTAIVLEEVTYRTGNAVLLDGVSCTLEQGHFTALLGPNGAGKTTLLNVISGQLRPSKGSATLKGRPLARWRPAELAKIRAYMPQHSNVSFHFTVEEIVALGRYPHRLQPLPDEADIPMLALETVGIQAYAGRHYNSLSGGEKARVQFARALAQIWQPDDAGRQRQRQGAGWLLLDEPTAALDWRHQLQIMQIAREWSRKKAIGVVAVLHDLNLALRYADSVLVLQSGALAAAGGTEQTLTPETVESIWQVRCEKTRRSCGSSHLML